MALFTSDGLGFGKGTEGGLSALPMAVGCVSPFSVALLWFYAKTLDVGGPSYALRTHTLICAGTAIVAGWILKYLDSYLHSMDHEKEQQHNTTGWSEPCLFLLFVFQSAYVQLLYNQHWAFISSVLTPEEGTKYFAPIAGLGSIGSTLAAGSVSVLIDRLGLISLLYISGASYIVCAVLSDVAFGLARIGGFEPGRGKDVDGISNNSKQGNGGSSISTSPSGDKSTGTTSTKSKGGCTPMKVMKQSESMQVDTPKLSPTSFRCAQSYTAKGSIFQQAHALFKRVPVLEALFFETVVSQCLSSLVNFIYLCKLKSTIIDDAERAGWSGSFYAWINGISGVFQFFAIPILLKYFEAHRIWLFMPTLMLCCTLLTFATFQTSGLFGASASFFAVKTMEYSLRGAASEMLYVSLDYESRYLGKKVISLIAGKFGKSAMAVALAGVMVIYGDNHNVMWYLVATANIFTCLWLLSCIRLHRLIEASK